VGLDNKIYFLLSTCDSNPVNHCWIMEYKPLNLANQTMYSVSDFTLKLKWQHSFRLHFTCCPPWLHSPSICEKI